jgi:hypothetical protein
MEIGFRLKVIQTSTVVASEPCGCSLTCEGSSCLQAPTEAGSRVASVPLDEG